MLALLAQLGNRSLQVDVDPQTGVITLPPDTTLENGRWILLQDGTEIGAFDVTEGVVGTAYSTRPKPRTVILDLFFVGAEEARRPRKTGIAGTLDRELYFSEFTIHLLDGNTEPCPGCGQIHTMDQVEAFGSFFELTPDVPLQTPEHFRTWARETSVETLLEGIIANNDVLSEHGYGEMNEVQDHLTRLRAVLAWQPKSPAPAPAADPSGESASQ